MTWDTKEVSSPALPQGRRNLAHSGQLHSSLLDSLDQLSFLWAPWRSVNPKQCRDTGRIRPVLHLGRLLPMIHISTFWGDTRRWRGYGIVCNSTCIAISMTPGLLESVRAYTLSVFSRDSGPEGSTMAFVDIGKTFIVNRG